MKVRDLITYIFDRVVIYQEDKETIDEWKYLYKGYINKADDSILELNVLIIGGNKNGVVEIEVE